MRRALIVLSLALTACGARSGLETPPPSIDASVPFDAFRPDAPPDAFRPDAPPDAPPDAFVPPDAPRCVLDSDCDDGLDCTIDRCERNTCLAVPVDDRCDDGLFCTGVERCLPGLGCAATPPRCADPVACTVDRCDEGLDRCVSDPDPTRCPISHRCDPVRGCIARALAHDPTTLYEIDLPGGALHVLGPTGVTLTDLALHPDGTLYGAVPGELVRVDYIGMSVETVVPVEGEFNALDVAPDGTLYGAAGDRIVRFDLVRGTQSTAARFPPGLASSGDVAFVEGRLYGTARTFSDDVLVLFDLAAGTSRVVGRIGRGCVWGLAPFGTTLYGLTCDGILLSIDVTRGTGTILSRGSTMFYGAGAR